jgi:hypothetical protein
MGFEPNFDAFEISREKWRNLPKATILHTAATRTGGPAGGFFSGLLQSSGTVFSINVCGSRKFGNSFFKV